MSASEHRRRDIGGHPHTVIRQQSRYEDRWRADDEIRHPADGPGDPRPLRHHDRRLRHPAGRAGRPHGEVRQQPADDERAERGRSRRPGASISRSRSSTAAGSAHLRRRTARASAASSARRAGPTSCRPRISGATNGVLHGDFGYSIDLGEPVNDRIIRAALPTLILATRRARHLDHASRSSSGCTSAVRRYSLFDQASTIFAYVGFAMPTFWLGIMLIYIFSGPA